MVGSFYYEVHEARIQVLLLLHKVATMYLDLLFYIYYGCSTANDKKQVQKLSFLAQAIWTSEKSEQQNEDYTQASSLVNPCFVELLRLVLMNRTGRSIYLYGEQSISAALY